jgi:hypothetical protein
MGGEEEKLILILNLGTRWGGVVSVTPRPRFTPEERTPCTHWIGGWVGPRAGLDAGARRKIVQPVVRHYTAWATAAPLYYRYILNLYSDKRSDSLDGRSDKASYHHRTREKLSVNFYQTTRRSNPEDNHLHTRSRENLKSQTEKADK